MNRCRALCWDAPKGGTPAEKLRSYRDNSVSLFLLIFVPLQLIPAFAELFVLDGAHVTPRVFAWTRFTFWLLMAILMRFVLYNPSERSARKFMMAAWGAFLMPAAAFSFVTAGLIYDEYAGDDLPWAWFAMVGQITTLLAATGVGFINGAQSIAPALREFGVESETASTLMTFAGFGTRFSGNVLLAQGWSLADPYCVLYIACWNLLFLVKSAARYAKWRRVRYACNFAHVIIPFVLIIRLVNFINENPQVSAVVGVVLQLYLRITLQSTITAIIVRYYTATLTRLVILGILVPLDRPDEVELAPVATRSEEAELIVDAEQGAASSERI